MPYVQFLGTESDYYFVSQIPALHGKPYVLTREEYTKKILTRPPFIPEGLYILHCQIQGLKQR